MEADPSTNGSIAGKASSMKLDHQFIRVPFHHFNHTFLTNHPPLLNHPSSLFSTLHPTFPQPKSNKGKGNCKGSDEDMISSLPDEVIIGILSKLHLKEAGRSSVLSKRWRDLWTYLTDLDFDDSKTLCFLPHFNNPFIKVNKYVNWVNQVLYAGRSLHLNSLRIHFMINNTFSSYVSNWFDFAMSSKLVKHLYLNLGTYASDLISNACCLKPISYIYKNENLQSLSLVSVIISDQLLDSILAHCPNLERLSLSSCRGFTRFKLVASSSASNNKLKHLLIQECNDTYDVEIYAPNLTCFTFMGWPMHNVNFLHVPNLTEVAFGGSFSIYLLENLQGSYSEYIIRYLDSFLSFSSQLHKVSLYVHKQVRYSSSTLGAALGNLKQLELIVPRDYNCVLLTSFIEACPLLETFKLKLVMGLVSCIRGYVADQSRGEIAKLNKNHNRLKTIEYMGSLGSESSLKLALCLTDQCLLLETFHLECCFLGYTGERRLCDRDQYANKLRIYSMAAHFLAEKILRIKPVNIVIMCD